jgi:tetratricopeptide (TPR) repeat protein
VHPDVALSLSNLGAVYVAQGQYEEAAPLYRRALAIREHSREASGSDLDKVLEDYAGVLRKLRQDTAAGELEGRARAMRATQGSGPR